MWCFRFRHKVQVISAFTVGLLNINKLHTCFDSEFVSSKYPINYKFNQTINTIDGYKHRATYIIKRTLGIPITVYKKGANNTIIELLLLPDTVTTFLANFCFNPMYAEHRINRALVTKITNINTGKEMTEIKSAYHFNGQLTYRVGHIVETAIDPDVDSFQKNRNVFRNHSAPGVYVFFDKSMTLYYDEFYWTPRLENNHMTMYDTFTGDILMRCNKSKIQEYGSMHRYCKKLVCYNQSIVHDSLMSIQKETDTYEYPNILLLNLLLN